MNKKLILFFVLSIFVFIIPAAHAGNEIIDYMTHIIYDGCKGQDIDVGPLGLKYTATNKAIPVVKWPYPIEYVHRIVEIIIENEPFGINLVDKRGMELLSCGNNKLYANFYTYKWNGERIDPFIYNYNNTINQITKMIQNAQGAVNPILTQKAGSNPSSVVSTYEMTQNAQGANKPAMAQSAGSNPSAVASTQSWFTDNKVTIEISFVISLAVAFTMSLAFSLYFKIKKKIIKNIPQK